MKVKRLLAIMLAVTVVGCSKQVPLMDSDVVKLDDIKDNMKEVPNEN